MTIIKIDKLLMELQQLFIEAKQGKIKLTDEMFDYIINLLTNKHFTHFKDQMPSTLLGRDGKEGLFDWLNRFTKSGLFKLILEEIFLPSEIQKVMNSVLNVSAKGIVANDFEKQLQDRVASLQFKYKDMFAQVGKIGETNNVKNVLADPVH
ncbi:hypothetical protein [Bacillus sp. JJ722]|uniref:hypothetical protein n=1 Tax=Bacillus sp. JJ722 TaxID=3122973 RepID=UPI002FFE10F3